MSLLLEEQEVHINFSRKEEFAEIYCSDLTWITKMDELVKKAPHLYVLTAETEHGNTYRFPKRLLSLRSSLINREYTDEQRKEMADRLKAAREKKGMRFVKE